MAKQVAALGATAIADDAALVAAELVTNAAQHGEPPVWVTVSGDASLRPSVVNG